MKKMQKAIQAVLTLCLVCVLSLGFKEVAYAYDPFYWPVPSTTNWTTYSGHTGIDIQCGRGTAIYAAKAGTVVKVWNGDTCDSKMCGHNDGFGNGLVIRHNDGTWTEYAHLTNNSIAVANGAAVAKGTYLGKSGASGSATGPHLHFGIRQGSGTTYGNFWSCKVLNASDKAGVVAYEYELGKPVNSAKFSNISASKITETTAFIRADINDAVASNYSKVGAVWGTNPEKLNQVVEFNVLNILTYVDVTFAPGSGEGPALNPGTRYYYRFYITPKSGNQIVSELKYFDTPCTHNMAYSATDSQNPSCGIEGFKVNKCTKCGYTEKTVIDALKHEYTATVIAPTTEADGYTLNVCKNCGVVSYTDIVKKTLTGVVTIDGVTKYGESLVAKLTNTNATGTLSYQWYRSNRLIEGETTCKYLVCAEDIGRSISCTITSSDTSGAINANLAVIIDKADGPAAPTGLKAYATSLQGLADGKITGTTTAMEYSKSAKFTTAKACTSTKITKLAAGTYYVRIAETETTLAGAAKKLVVKDGSVALIGNVRVTGSPYYAKTLTATITDTNNTGVLSYQWTRDGEAIAGATLPTYKITKTDIGKKVTCTISSTKEVGTLIGNDIDVILATPKTTVTKYSSGLILEWSTVSQASGYYVYRKQDGGKYVKIATITGGTQTGYIDKTVVKGNTYIYAVKAYRGSVTGKFTAVTATYGLVEPVTTVKKTTTGVKVSWTASEGCEGYYVYRKEGTGKYVKIATVTDPTKLYYVDKTSVSGKSYTYATVAYAGTDKSTFTGVSFKY